MREVARALRLWLVTALKAAPLMVAVQCVLAIVQAMTAPAQAYGVKLLIDGIGAGQNTTIAWGLGIIMVGFGVMFLGNVLRGPFQDTTAERVFGQVYGDVMRVTTSVPGIAHHERPDIADKVELIREHAWKLGVSFELLLFMLGTLANSVAVLALLSSVSPMLLLLPLLGLARVWSAYMSVKKINKAFESTLPEARMVDRLIDIIKEPKHAMELRVFGLRKVLVDRLTKLQILRSHAEVGASLRGAVLDGIVRIFFGFSFAAAIVWLIWRARNGQANAGDVVLLILVAPQVDQLAGGIAGNVYWLGDVLRCFKRFDWLLQYADQNSWRESTEAAPLRLHSGITLRDVGFSYPGGDRPVLANIDLTFPAGSTIALVGENGAGKTTLVKVLSRLYDPTEGAVLVDGVDLRRFDAESWRLRTSAGFQDFVKWEFLARETVGIGQVDRLSDGELVDSAIRRGDAGVVVEKLPSGLETQLGKRFTDGRDLSGGQWQRLALARAFMREEPLLLLLDEPTAALDPEAEHALFDQFAAASRVAAQVTGGITILVSHRFSTVRMADLIVVLDSGRVLEVGTHEELAAAGGRYAELFEMQARAYR